MTEDELKTLLTIKNTFFEKVAAVGKRPFEPRIPCRRRSSPLRAGARRWLLPVLFALCAGAVLCAGVVLHKELYLKGSSASPGVRETPATHGAKETPASREQPVVVDLLNQLTTNVAALISPKFDRVDLDVGIAMVALTIAFLLWLLEIPARRPDPLFGRLLQRKFKSVKPFSRRFLRALLAEPSFRDICSRATALTFPSIQEGTEFSDKEKQSFIDRLAEFLFKEKSLQFRSYSENHPGMPTANPGLLYELQYGAREMLFEAILADPDFKYIYDEKLHQWRNWGARFASIEWEKVVDQAKKFGEWLKKPTEKPESADKSPGLATPTLVTLVIVAVVVVFGTRRTEPPQPPQQKIALEWNGKEAFDQLSKSIAAVGVALGKLQPPSQTPAPQASPIYVSSPPITITNPPVTATVVTSPATTLTAESSPSTDVKVATLAQAADAVLMPLSEKSRRTDDAQPKNGTGGDDYLVFTSAKNAAQADGNLTLHTASGHVCAYAAELVDKAKWLPDPIQIQVNEADKKNGHACPPFDKNDVATQPKGYNIISAAHVPMYSELLKAYVSVDEAKKRYLRFHGKNLFFGKNLGKDLLVLRVHYQSPPHEQSP